MSRTLRRARRAVALTLPLAFALPVVTAAHADDSSFQTVVEGLRNPRGLAMSADGRLYVAESGESGAGPDSVCFAGEPTEEGGELCVDMSARISRIDTGSGTRNDFINGLVSLGGPLFALGASGVAVKGNQVFGLMGANDVGIPPAEACGGGPECRAILAAAQAQLGHLLRGVPSGNYQWKQDVGAFNYRWTVDNKDSIGLGDPTYQPGWAANPDFQPGDANPYGLASAPGGTYTVDGGANTLTWVPQQGDPVVVAAFPDPDPSTANAYDAVPTCVAPTAGGVIVADLNGRVFVVDGSSVTLARAAITPVDGAFLVAAGGCAADGRGNVYISDIFLGSVVKLALATMEMSWVRPPGTLNFPTGVAIGHHGEIYIANNGVCPSFPLPAGDPQNPCGGVTGSIVRLNA
jgi:hypothetical protein